MQREPLYFGKSETLLFGCYHAPQSTVSKTCGVVLSYPMGQEYMRAHRAYVQLAVRLARAGFPSLRFDFLGCGDSSGEYHQAHIGQWVNDLNMAIGEIRRLIQAVNGTCLMGLRMGATLSAMAAVERSDVEYLVLWNPVVNGRSHLNELETVHREMLRYSYVDVERNGHNQAISEILGFPFSAALSESIGKIDLLAMPGRPASHVLLLDSAKDRQIEQLGRHLEDLGADVRLQQFHGPRLWLEEPYKSVVPNEVWQCAVAWLSEVAS